MDIQQAKAEVSAALVEIAEQLEVVLNRKGAIPQIELDLLLTNTQKLYSYLVVLSRLNAGGKADGNEKAKQEDLPVVKQEEIARMVQSEVVKLRDEMFRTFTAKTVETTKTTEPMPVVETVLSPITPVNSMPSAKPQMGPSPEKLAKIKENPYIGKTVMPNGFVEAKQTEVLLEEAPVEVKKEVAPVENFIQPEPAPEVKPYVQPEPEVKAFVQPEPVIQPVVEQKFTTPLDVTLPPLTTPTALFDEKPTVNVEDNSVANKLRGKSITSIKAAIGINDKFQYLNDLFKGNVQDYNESLDSLNNFSTIEQAEAHFNALRSKFGWDMENNSAAGLYDLVIRRYLK